MDPDTPYTSLAGKIAKGQSLCLLNSPPPATVPFRSALEAQKLISITLTNGNVSSSMDDPSSPPLPKLPTPSLSPHTKVDAGSGLLDKLEELKSRLQEEFAER